MWRLDRVVLPITMLRIVTPRTILVAALVAVFAASGWRANAQSDPLPSWNDGATKKSIVDFVGRVTREGGPDFVPVPERIATFDNDGTLWCEQPMYFQLAFALRSHQGDGAAASGVEDQTAVQGRCSMAT